MEKRIIPNFATEAEEAKWWFDNQDELNKDFAQALPKAVCDAGRNLGHGTRSR
jgi:hypothetical protein